MRIVSLLPAATEWLCAFGAGDRLVGRSHACDHPTEVLGLPVLTRWARAAVPALEVDRERLRALAPDLIVAPEEVGGSDASWAAGGTVYAPAPTTFKQVLDVALHLGRLAGCMPAAMPYVARHEARLQELRQHLGLHKRTDTATLPMVACLAATAPLSAAGRWVPELVELAGGRAVLAEAGRPSAPVTWDALQAADPDVIVVASAGGLRHLTEAPAGRTLAAVRAGRVYLCDAAYFDRPGPRLYRAVELLAAVLHPGRLPDAFRPTTGELITLDGEPLSARA